MNVDAENLSDFEYEEDEALQGGSGTSVNQKSDVKGLTGLVIWTASSATFLYTAKKLLSHSCPLALSFYYFITILAVYLLITILSYTHTANENGIEDNVRWNSRRMCATWFAPNRHWVAMLPASLGASLSLPTLLEGLLHMPSLPVLVMVFPLVYATESMILLITGDQLRSGIKTYWQTWFIVAATGIILYNENRLMVPGRLWAVIGTVLLGTSRACFVLGSSTVEDSDFAIKSAYHAFVMMGLFFGVVISGLMAAFVEGWHFRSLFFHEINFKLFLSVIAFVGTSLVAYGVSSHHKRASSSELVSGLLLSVGSNCIVLLTTIFSSPLSFVSWIQLNIYFAVLVILIGPALIYDWITDLVIYKTHIRKNILIEKQSFSKFVTLGPLALIAIFISFILSINSSAAINSLPRGPSAAYDRSYTAKSRFDIVVSMYKEDPESVRHMLAQIKSTSLLQFLDFQSHTPRVILYTKDPSADLERLQETTGADIIKCLENIGREGGTYLSHIIEEWDFLAEQTMFIQAHAHNMRELIPRINDYLVPDTGMLSLGFTGVTCYCDSCEDRWGWEDRNRIIPALYEKVYNTSCNPSQPILLSYKGQFVASARRIRGWSLEHDTSLDGNDNGDGVEGENTPSNPQFGFTMERLWSLLMRCAADERVAARCPSLLSGKGLGGLAQDCQCLDI